MASSMMSTVSGVFLDKRFFKELKSLFFTLLCLGRKLAGKQQNSLVLFHHV